VSVRPDEERRKDLRDQYRAARPPSFEGGSTTALFLTIGLSGGAIAALVGGVLGGFYTVKQGVVADLWRQGRHTELVMVAMAAIVAAGLVLLWNWLRKGKIKAKFGVWAGAVPAGLVVAPASVAAGALPLAVFFAFFGFALSVLVLALIVWGQSKPSLVPWLLGGAVGGCILGCGLRLAFSALDAVRETTHDELGAAFHQLFHQVVADATGTATLVCGVVGTLLGLVLCWRLHVEGRAVRTSPP
jgi:hypothetical protein